MKRNYILVNNAYLTATPSNLQCTTYTVTLDSHAYYSHWLTPFIPPPPSHTPRAAYPLESQRRVQHDRHSPILTHRTSASKQVKLRIKGNRFWFWSLYVYASCIYFKHRLILPIFLSPILPHHLSSPLPFPIFFSFFFLSVLWVKLAVWQRISWKCFMACRRA